VAQVESMLPKPLGFTLLPIGRDEHARAGHRPDGDS
jgi:hypothetical protein